MKIAQVTPLYEAVPPRLYGGTERVVAHLGASGAARLGTALATALRTIGADPA